MQARVDREQHGAAQAAERRELRSNMVKDLAAQLELLAEQLRDVEDHQQGFQARRFAAAVLDAEVFQLFDQKIANLQAGTGNKKRSQSQEQPPCRRNEATEQAASSSAQGSGAGLDLRNSIGTGMEKS